MLFSPIDPLWVGLIVLVLFVLIYGLCYCLNREAVKTGQKILTEQQESMSEEEKGLKRKRKKKGDTVLSGENVDTCKVQLAEALSFVWFTYKNRNDSWVVVHESWETPHSLKAA